MAQIFFKYNSEKFHEETCFTWTLEEEASRNGEEEG